jgi:hypothetical protein
MKQPSKPVRPPGRLKDKAGGPEKTVAPKPSAPRPSSVKAAPEPVSRPADVIKAPTPAPAAVAPPTPAPEPPEPAPEQLPPFGNYTIKAFPTSLRIRIAERASAMDMTQADWVAEAVRRFMDHLNGIEVLSPDSLGGLAPRSSLLPVDLGGMAQLLRAITDAATARDELPPPSLHKAAASTMRLYMRSARGLTDGQTGAKFGQTAGQTTIRGTVDDAGGKRKAIAGPRKAGSNDSNGKRPSRIVAR